MFDRLSLRHSWYRHVPPSIEADQSVAAFARSLISTVDSVTRKDSTAALASSRLQIQAIQTLRARLDGGDFSLLCVALLLFTESLRGADIELMQRHLHGMQQIVEARSQGLAELSSLGQVLVTGLVDEYWAIGVGLGRVHPFDTAHWRKAGPREDDTMLRLRYTKFRLTIQTPRLIAGVRECLGPNATPGLIRDTIVLADELLHAVDNDAETDLLHRLKIVPTTSSSKKVIMQYSYEYTTFGQCELAIHYWFLQLITIKLRLVLASLEPELQCLSDDSLHDGCISYDISQWSAQQPRLIANIMMSWHTCLNTKYTTRGPQVALMVLWNALADMDTFRGLPASVVRSWVLRTFQQTLSRLEHRCQCSAHEPDKRAASGWALRRTVGHRSEE